MENYDFSGWATRANLKCSDGRTIMKDAFKQNSGQTVPLVWNHQHNDPNNVLGHALLENREEGVYVYGKFNDSESGKTAKLLIEHGDVNALSIHANQLKQHMSNVLHGNIREVSLVLAGANPGAYIESIISHGEESDEEAIIYTDEHISLTHADSDKTVQDVLDELTEEQHDVVMALIAEAAGIEDDEDEEDDISHSSDSDKTVQDVLDGLTEEQRNVVYALLGEAAGIEDDEDEEVSHADGSGKTVQEILDELDDEQRRVVMALIGVVADEAESPEDDEEIEHADSDKTVQDVLDELTEEQRKVVYALLAEALNEKDNNDSEGGNTTMKHNVFDNETETVQGKFISHSDQEAILEMAKSSQVGSFQAALQMYAEDNELQHDAVSGFAQAGEGNISTLFPEYHDVRSGAPELLTNDQSWVDVVMKKVTKSPFARIRTSHVDIRKIDELRAKGYKKGNRKGVVGNYNLVRRTTDPQTVFVKSALHRDDTVDITDFDIVAYQYKIDRMNLMEELATAIVFGDGREVGAEDKIDPDKIRPVWGDDPLYTKYVNLDFDAAANELQGSDTTTYFGTNFIKAEAMVNACLYAREDFKGTGTPDMLITPHELNVMLMARDRNGHRLYHTKAELAQALDVGAIYTCEQMAGKTRTDSEGKTKKLHALIFNFADYSLGSVKGGEVTHFTQFDIDFNQLKSLLETRCSGANTRVYSAIAIEEEVTAG